MYKFRDCKIICNCEVVIRQGLKYNKIAEGNFSGWIYLNMWSYKFSKIYEQWNNMVENDLLTEYKKTWKSIYFSEKS